MICKMLSFQKKNSLGIRRSDQFFHGRIIISIDFQSRRNRIFSFFNTVVSSKFSEKHVFQTSLSSDAIIVFYCSAFLGGIIPVCSSIQSRNKLTCVNPSGAPSSQLVEPKETMPTCSQRPLPSFRTKGPPESP